VIKVFVEQYKFYFVLINCVVWGISCVHTCSALVTLHFKDIKSLVGAVRTIIVTFMSISENKADLLVSLTAQ
jgi:hypothetical protein